ncbi:MAG TPA: DNA-directed RNA polymerase subunit beta [Patescibacteria group bacterium]|nr:DNA-directed RNA polymerase subunit beta [Patescibacteria group bacterium]
MGKRKYFTKSKYSLGLPDLIKIQKDSYDWFLNNGLEEVIKEISPIQDAVGKNYELHFLGCHVDEPKFDEMTSRNRNLTYKAPVNVKIRLINKKTGKKQTQEVYFGDMPLMSKRGTFIINGIERVIVSQLIRSPGVYISRENVRGRFCYGGKIIPERGSWLEFITDRHKVVWVRIDRQRKIPATALLRVFGIGSDKEILDWFKGLGKKEMEYLKETLEKDPSSSEKQGFVEVYKKMRPGELPTIDNARSLIEASFFRHDRYDLSKVGRFKLNQRLGFKKKIEKRVLRTEDIFHVLKEIISLNVSQEPADDIDHLSSRRVRAVGELVQSRMRVGMLRMQRIVKDRMSTIEAEKMTPGKLVNIRPIGGVLQQFFMSSPLSHFMDQVNILSELEHKRRLTVSGPGGLNKDRAGLEVRDVHRTYYGKICPIQTPEGPNIGLVNQLACFARLNNFGFIETPYRKVQKGKLTNEIVYLNAKEEEEHVLAPFSVKVDQNGKIIENIVEARIHGKPSICDRDEVEFIDTAPNQIISVATSLIPFLEHNDAARALMGSNMQRQAVPLCRPEAPLVGTGVEKKVAEDSGYVIKAKEDGKIVEVDSKHIVVKYKSGKKQEFELEKYQRSNFDTCFNQRPRVDQDQKIKKGDVLVEGASTEDGELALGENVLCAFMPWEGGNYEDAILISSRLAKTDKYSSIHIKEHTIDVRETKFGKESTTCDIPNVSEKKLKDLDEDGIVRIGAKVKSGDILVGKITPEGEVELTPEEKLLHAIFGEKSQDVRDSSLYLEHGEEGKVIGVRIFSRDAGDKLKPGIIKSIQVLVADMKKIQVGDKMSGRHGNKGVISKIVPEEDMPYLKDGTPVDVILNPLGVVSRMNLGQILETHLGLAANELGYKVATPTLNGLSENQIRQELKKAGFPEDGKLTLYNGKTGERFENNVTVGYIYMLKLNHLVEDKIHKRSIGPYSLVTQQPLGGKAQFGGQRFGEMEVWALEGYGAAYTLQEMLTIKSDDVVGRNKAYSSIMEGEPVEEINTPEAFNVLVRELRGLCLETNMLKNGKRVKIKGLHKNADKQNKKKEKK